MTHPDSPSWKAAKTAGDAMTDFLAHALDYHRRGWCIIPIGADKKPALRTWKSYQTARPTEETLRDWFEEGEGVIGPVTGMAVVCGIISDGLACRDFDAADSYQCWVAEHSDMAKNLPTVQTARGYHVYFAGPAGYHDFGNGEYRGNAAHYTLLPPSRHPSGMAYRWVVPLPGGPLPVIDPVEAGLLPPPMSLGRNDHSQPAGVGTEEDRKKTERPPKITERSMCGGGFVRKQKLKTISLDELENNILERIALAVRAALPEEEGQRQRRIFKLARTLKGISALADADPRCLRPVMEQWHRLALPNMKTTDFAVTWVDFLRGWPKVKFPRGAKMNIILENAKAAPDPMEAQRYESPEIRLLIKLCRTWQKDAGDGPFYLSARIAGELLGIPRMQAWRHLFLLESDGLLQIVERGSKGGKATRWRYIGEQSETERNRVKLDRVNKKLAAAFSPRNRDAPLPRHIQLAKLRQQAEAWQRLHPTPR